MNSFMGKVVTISFLAIAFTGCAGSASNQFGNNIKIIVNDRGVPNYYRVQSGDTVSHIANRYHLNYRKVGSLNNLDPNYTIYSGQWLKLWNVANTTTKNTYVKKPQNIASNNTSYNKPAVPIQTNNSYATNYPKSTAQSQAIFNYPTTNTIIRQFDSSSNVQGIWFAGNTGDPIYASGSGSVIYAGNGLSEYGNLIMIRHANDYVTAYAHANELLVIEGQSIQKGQKIATIGSTGNITKAALEFQVRKGGKVINPLTVLRK